MARPRSLMRKIKEVLRLQLGEGLSRRQVSRATGLPYTTVADHVARARRAGLTWPMPEDMSQGSRQVGHSGQCKAPAGVRWVRGWCAARPDFARDAQGSVSQTRIGTGVAP